MFDISKAKYWAIIPAAGIGQRFGEAIPKQYLSLQGKSVLAHSIATLLHCSFIEKIVVVIAKTDQQWLTSALAEHPKIVVTVGGAERCHSIGQGLQQLRPYVADHDWVLTHDAVRPCLRFSDIQKLIADVAHHPVGGLLGVRVRDTVKRVDTTGAVVTTVPRDDLWLAFTPQMFRFQLLYEAIGMAIEKKVLVTDEAAAVEMLGKKPQLVEGCSGNIKITYPSDLALAAHYLKEGGNK